MVGLLSLSLVLLSPVGVWGGVSKILGLFCLFNNEEDEEEEGISLLLTSGEIETSVVFSPDSDSTSASIYLIYINIKINILYIIYYLLLKRYLNH